MLTKEETEKAFEHYLDYVVQNELHVEPEDLWEKIQHDLIHGYDKEGSKNERKP